GARPGDGRDLLPPVSCGPASLGGPTNGAVAPRAGPAGNGLAGYQGTLGVPGQGHVPAVPAPGVQGEAGPAARTVGPVSPWSPLVIATVAMIVAISVMAPILGTGLALAVLVALRAATITSRQLERRRAADGGRAGLSVLAVALYPLAALRALLGLLLAAPVALLAFCVTVAVTIIAVPVHPLPQAVALGAGALVAVMGLGPGSAASRTALARLYTSAARSTSMLAIAYAGVIGVAAWAAVTAWYQSPAPAYWPISSLHDQLQHLPTIRTMLTDVRQNLLRLAHQIGL
ncbi:MAG TPA: hypothetical protein VF162_08395, partial [Streptosporangiaceae bacterium]